MRHGGSTLTSIEREKLPVMLSIRGEQYYDNIPPDATELMTEGTMELTEGGGMVLRYMLGYLVGIFGGDGFAGTGTGFF